jgi:hypothetical protein
MNSEFERFFWQQRELERALQGMRSIIDTCNSIPQSVFDSLSMLDRLRDQFTLPADYLTSTSKIFDAVAQRPSIESLEILYNMRSPAIEAFQREQARIEELMRSLSTPALDIQKMLRPMLDSLAPTEALLSLERLKRELIDVAIQPQLAYQEFAKKQLNLLAGVSSEIEKHNRLSLLDSSAYLLDSVTRGFELAGLMCPISEELWIGSLPEVNVYNTLEDELEVLDFDQEVIDTESLVEKSQSGMIADFGARIVQLVYNLNIEAEREGQPPLFKPTTKALMACAVIPSRVVHDSASFAEITDHLFFLLYEGSGSANRLITQYDKSKLEALWRLKHLRLGARHDISHGTDQEIEKKNRQVGEAYLALIGQVVPRSKAEWILAQLALYRELSDMLERIWHGDM